MPEAGSARMGQCARLAAAITGQAPRWMTYLAKCCLALSLTATAGISAFAGTVSVTFVEPEKYTDIRDAHWDFSANLQGLADYLQSLGAQYLAPDQSLHVEVMDVDLAGVLRVARRAGLVRVIGRPTDWPSMTLRYHLEGGAQTRDGSATVSDMAYDLHLDALSWDALALEKRMLKKWFRQEFAQPVPH